LSIKVPDAQLEHLPRAPLRVAVAQVRYAPVYAVEKREKVADFEARLADGYIAEPQQVPQGIAIQFGASASVAPPFPAPEAIWPFIDRDRGFRISVSSSSLALESLEGYDDFPAFLSEVRSLVEAFHEVFSPKEQHRVGLRYVNHIEDDRLKERESLVNFVNPELLTPVGGAAGFDVLRTFGEAHFNEEFGTFVLRHGLIDDTTYLLDFDYFAEERGAFKVDESCSTLESFHTLIERFFVWAISPRYLNELREA
jgi:uncharacterized protein (TIGR04255 family)